MNYPQKTGFNLYQSRHCAYITYSVKTWFLKISLCIYIYNTLIYYIKLELFLLLTGTCKLKQSIPPLQPGLCDIKTVVPIKNDFMGFWWIFIAVREFEAFIQHYLK